MAVERKLIAREVRERVFARYGHRCVRCGRRGRLTIDHRIPLSRGGTDDEENLQPMCRGCNNRKGDGIERPPIRRSDLDPVLRAALDAS